MVATRKSLEPLVKVTLNLYAADYERFKTLFETISPAQGIRAVMRNYLERYDQRMAQTTATVSEIELSDEELAHVRDQ